MGVDDELVGFEMLGQRRADAEPHRVSGGQDDRWRTAQRQDLGQQVVDAALPFDEHAGEVFLDEGDVLVVDIEQRASDRLEAALLHQFGMDFDVGGDRCDTGEKAERADDGEGVGDQFAEMRGQFADALFADADDVEPTKGTPC
jgi:hypothetical protein